MSSTLISCNNTIATAMFEMARNIKQNMLFQRVVGYSPAKAPAGLSSLCTIPGQKRLISPTFIHTVVPKGAIIVRVEFMGFNDFTTGRFDIGLGTFNNPINFPLINNASADIANEPIGGIRDFRFDELTGANDHAVVAQDSYINMCATGPISGDLQVIIYFYIRPAIDA